MELREEVCEIPWRRFNDPRRYFIVGNREEIAQISLTNSFDRFEAKC